MQWTCHSQEQCSAVGQLLDADCDGIITQQDLERAMADPGALTAACATAVTDDPTTEERLTRQALRQLLAHSSTNSSSEIECASDSSNEQESDSPVSAAVVTAVMKLRRAAAAMRSSGASAWSAMDAAAAGESPNGMNLNEPLGANAVYAIFCSLGQPVHLRARPLLTTPQMPRGHVRRHVSITAATAASNSTSNSSNNSSAAASSSPAAAAVRQPHSTAAASENSGIDSDNVHDSLALLQHIEQQSAEQHDAALASARTSAADLQQLLLLSSPSPTASGDAPHGSYSNSSYNNCGYCSEELDTDMSLLLRTLMQPRSPLQQQQQYHQQQQQQHHQQQQRSATAYASPPRLHLAAPHDIRVALGHAPRTGPPLTR
eukprot:6670-Heterococcus_DN1.PRE.4